MDEMILIPAEGVSESTAKGIAPTRNPWIYRSELGLIKATFATLRRSFFAPRKLIQEEPVPRQLFQAFGFALLIHYITPLPQYALIFMASRGFGPPPLSTILFMLYAPLLAILGWVVLAASAHLILKLTHQTEHPIARTIEAGLYCSACIFLCVVPILGWLALPIVPIWWLITMSAATVRLHSTSAIRALAATAFLPAIIILAFMAYTTHGIAKSVGRSQAQAPNLHYYASRPINDLWEWRRRNNAWPAHSYQAIADHILQPSTLQMPRARTGLSDVEVLPSLTFRAAMSLQPNQQAALVSQLNQSLPPDLIAHRLGDIIFTYHGLNAQSYQYGYQGHWLAVWCMHPSQQALNISSRASELQNTRIVFTVDGQELTYDAFTFPIALAAENRARAAINLPPLPDLENFDWIATASTPGSQPMPPLNIPPPSFQSP